jgi:hypothetical protein
MFVIRTQWLPAFLSLVSAISWGQAVPAEKADEARIDRLLGQLTLEEKMDLIRGGTEDPAAYQGKAAYLPGVLAGAGSHRDGVTVTFGCNVSVSDRVAEFSRSTNVTAILVERPNSSPGTVTPHQ